MLEERPQTIKIATPTATRALIDRHDFRWRKRWGQNFLIEPDVVRRIVAEADLDQQDIALEIGPGLGGMTQELLVAAGHLVALEIDPELVNILRQTFAGVDSFTLIQGDALKIDLAQTVAKVASEGNFRPGFVVVANLPYYITTPLIFHLLESGAPWRRLVLMVQKEVAQRLQAPPGGKDYGALSVAIQYRATARVAFTVPPTVFCPRPNVDSAVVVLERLEQPFVEVLDEKTFFAVVAAAFGQRRKTLSNALTAGLHLEKEAAATLLSQAGIDSQRRGETLSLEEFAVLANALVHLG